jgi:hypothetical protein
VALESSSSVAHIETDEIRWIWDLGPWWLPTMFVTLAKQRIPAWATTASSFACWEIILHREVKREDRKDSSRENIVGPMLTTFYSAMAWTQ